MKNYCKYSNQDEMIINKYYLMIFILSKKLIMNKHIVPLEDENKFLKQNNVIREVNSLIQSICLFINYFIGIITHI